MLGMEHVTRDGDVEADDGRGRRQARSKSKCAGRFVFGYLGIWVFGCVRGIGQEVERYFSEQVQMSKCPNCNT